MCDRFPRKFDVQIVNIKFPRATYRPILPSTGELYCLKSLLVGIQSEHAVSHIRGLQNNNTKDKLV